MRRYRQYMINAPNPRPLAKETVIKVIKDGKLVKIFQVPASKKELGERKAENWVDEQIINANTFIR